MSSCERFLLTEVQESDVGVFKTVPRPSPVVSSRCTVHKQMDRQMQNIGP